LRVDQQRLEQYFAVVFLCALTLKTVPHFLHAKLIWVFFTCF